MRPLRSIQRERWRCLRGAALGALCVWATGSAAAQERASPPADSPGQRPIEEITVTGEKVAPPLRPSASPRTTISELEAQSINVATVEDLLSYEPSLVIRRRYIGDSNGALGMRGSNMSQTPRSMVFVDDLPLHNLLQFSVTASPRWSLVSPDEISGTEVSYGPFSAEQSGNAMGGVVQIQTRMPEGRGMNLKARGFSQSFDYLGADGRYGGRQLRGSYGDRVGAFSLYLSHDHLHNVSQPQTWIFGLAQDGPGPGASTSVGGAYDGQNDIGHRGFFYGETGRERVTTNLTKLKLGYEAGEWLGRFTLAFEDRRRNSEEGESYLRDALSGRPVYRGRVTQGGRSFTASPSGFSESINDRESLLLGGALDGPVGGDWRVELDWSAFELLRDDTRQGSAPRSDPAFDRSGNLVQIGDAGWLTFDTKLRTARLAGRDDLGLVVGYHQGRYRLEGSNYSSVDYSRAARSRLVSSSGGKTAVQAVFAEGRWQIDSRWDAQLGLRYERWRASDGVHGLDPDGVGPISEPFQRGAQPRRSESGLSPKFSLGFAPVEGWQFRYSIARAVRFAVVDELFRNVSGIRSTQFADATLEPERGLHHNLMIERQLGNGYLRANLFRERVRDVIYSQTLPGANGTTQTLVLPIDDELVSGAELIAQLSGLWGGKLDLRANLTYTRAKIVENSRHPAFEGNEFPRMPRWRGNALLTYHWSDRLDTSLGVQYSGDSDNRLDNQDSGSGFYGSVDGYRFVELRLGYRLGEQTRLSFGIDNVFDERSFVGHPWPGRTLYAEIDWSM